MIKYITRTYRAYTHTRKGTFQVKRFNLFALAFQYRFRSLFPVPCFNHTEARCAAEALLRRADSPQANPKGAQASARHREISYPPCGRHKCPQPLRTLRLRVSALKKKKKQGIGNGEESFSLFHKKGVDNAAGFLL